MKRPDQVLAGCVVNAGLPANGRIDRRQQRRGHLHKPHAPQPRCGRKPAQIPCNAPAERQHQISPPNAGVRQRVMNPPKLGDAFARLAGGKLDHRGGRDRKCLQQLRQVQPRNLRIRNDGQACAFRRVRDNARESGARSGTDVDRIFPPRQTDRNGSQNTLTQSARTTNPPARGSESYAAVRKYAKRT